MRKPWLPILFLCVGCATVGRLEDGGEDLNSGEVSHLAFSSNGKELVAVNQFKYFGNSPREKCHSRLRSFATSDWKMVGDTKVLSLVDLSLAPSTTQPWMIQAHDFARPSRPTTDTINPIIGPVYYQIDPVTLERKTIDIIQQKPHERDLGLSAVGMAGEKQICVVELVRSVSGRNVPQPAFLFDLKAGKKTVELQNFPTGAHDAYFMKTVLAFTPDGNHITSCHPCKPYQMQLHAAATGKLLKSMKLDSPVSVMAFSPNAKMLAALCWDGTLLIVAPDLSKQMVSKHVFAFDPDHYGFFPHAIAFVGDGHLAVLASSTKIELLETKEWKSVRSFEEPKNRINCLGSSPDGKLVAAGFGRTGLLPGFIRVWEAHTGKLVKELN